MMILLFLIQIFGIIFHNNKTAVFGFTLNNNNNNQNNNRNVVVVLSKRWNRSCNKRRINSIISLFPNRCSLIDIDKYDDNNYHHKAFYYISSSSSRKRRKDVSILALQSATTTTQHTLFDNNNDDNNSNSNSTSDTVATTTTTSNSDVTLTEESNCNNTNNSVTTTTTSITTTQYDLGVGKNRPKQQQQQSRSSSIYNDDNSHTSPTTYTLTPPPSPTTVSSTLPSEVEQQVQQPSIDVDTDEMSTTDTLDARVIGMNWIVPESVIKPSSSLPIDNNNDTKNTQQQQQQRIVYTTSSSSQMSPPPIKERKSRRMVARDNDGQLLRRALWDEQHYDLRNNNRDHDSSILSMSSTTTTSSAINGMNTIRPTNQRLPTDGDQQQQPSQRMYYSYSNTNYEPPYPKAFYPDIDLSIPKSVYDDETGVDLVWDLLRYEAYQNQLQQHEPLLVSFLHSTILNHDTLESSLAFLLANRLQSPAMMISTQLQALIYSTIQDCSEFRKKLRADIMAVRDRDPACHTLPDVFLYFKGFHALQSYRTAHVLWNTGRTVLAQYLQSQVSQIFQIDIHPNATIGSGIMLDHGTGIVIGETATVGHNCSILHQVTLGGSGKKGVVRHPQVGNGVLLGAGATILGPITIGDGSQIGAGTLVISNLPPHCVAVGVPARIIGSFINVTEQPSIGMDQIIIDSHDSKIITFQSDGI